MLVNLSYIKLKTNIIDTYTKSKKGWLNKDVEWDRLKNVLSSSKVQFSPYQFRNGVKTDFNWSNDKQDLLVFDVDDGLSLAECQKMFKRYKYLIGTTKSHQANKKGVVCDRYRLCIPAINIPREKEVYFKMLSLLVDFNDEQTEHGTGAFLGNDDAIIIYNEGKLLDCHKASLLAEQQIASEKVEKASIDRDLIPNYGGNNTIELIKKELTFEIVVDVLESVGYEVKANKFRLRDEERTDSATINYKSLVVKDFGSGWFGDIFSVLEEYQDMKLSEAIRYVSNYV